MHPEHQHRYRPTGTFTAGSIVFERFTCRCGRYRQIHPGIPEREWRWAYLTDAGVRREWKARCDS